MSNYFAYGSNLDVSRLLSRCPNAVIVGKATLDGYRLVFQNNNRGRIVANLIEDENCYVEGMVYDVEGKDIDTLDACEGVPFVYEVQQVELQGLTGNIKGFTYIMPQTFLDTIKKGKSVVRFKANRHFGEPTDEYLDHIVAGYKMFGLTMQYLKDALNYNGKEC